MYASDDKTRELVTIANIVYEANDVPNKDIPDFPWFKLYPADRKDTPVTYPTRGEHLVDAWARLIAEEG